MRESKSLNGLISPLGVSISSILKMVVTTESTWCQANFQPGEGVHEHDVCGAPIVDQDMSTSVIGYLDFSDQSIIVWVEKLVGFIVGEGNRDTILVGYLCDVFGHVNVFPTCYLPSLPSVTYPAACCITCDCSLKNGMDNVLELPNVSLITCSQSRVWSDLAGSIGPACRGECLGEILLQEFWALMHLQLYRHAFGLSPSSAQRLGNIISDCPKQHFVLDSLSKRLYEGVIGAILDLHDGLIKVVQVFALRNATEKASDNCLNKSIVPSINLRYHCPTVPVRVLISVRGAIIKGYG
ncbi:hypothetical protein TIFTF001_029742 [Ficus carica]|uniref:Uncharacterized protein n=1 Tax=Ficus carica TaxID=3494 RepID=A0AA88DS65_FICCA|nr:hypothetical protein TIFTF001_029742 [Ficus carica]